MPEKSAVRRSLLADNLHRVQERIAAACERARRDPRQVRLVAVTKSVDTDVIAELIELGHAELGESRAQELVRRAEWCRDQGLTERTGGPGVSWHMVGHLQRNKVRAILPFAGLIHSVDSLRLAEELSAQAQRQGRPVDCLLQVNAGAERAKFGVAVGATSYLIEQIVTLSGLRLRGLMTMAPITEPERTRPVFVRLRELFEDVRHDGLVGSEFTELSMGMSNDFEVAVEEGATIVRVGSAVFEGLAGAAA